MVSPSYSIKKGRVVSIETRKKMSEAKKGFVPWNKGKIGVYSIETLQKMSLAKKGKVKDYEPINSKLCSRCNTVRPITEFVKDKRIACGYGSSCKICQRIISKIYRDNNKDKSKLYCELNKEKKLLYGKLYYENNKDEILKKQHIYYISHKGQARKRVDDWRNKNREYYEQYNKKTYIINKNKRKEYLSNYYKTENGRLSRNRQHNKRQREFKTIELFINPFPEEIEVDYHHINNLLVIPLPRSLHMCNLGRNHRKKCNDLIKSIYNLDVGKLLSDSHG